MAYLMDLIESGRLLWSTRLESGDGPSDAKFAIGDLLADVEDEDLRELDKKIATDLPHSKLRSYRDVAKAWPADRRVAASWTTHRTLAKHQDRFDLICAGMTLREAQESMGKTPADIKHPARWDLDRRVLFVVDQLQDAAVTQEVRRRLDERKKARAAKAAVRLVEEDRSAEYRDALRQLREARDAKHPEAAAYDALFKVREAVEYVRAVGKAGAGEGSFLPEHMRPSLIAAIRDLATISVDVVAAMPDSDEREEALQSLSERISDLVKVSGEGEGPIVFESVESFGVIDSG